MKIALSSSTLRRMRVFAAMLIALAIMFAVIDAAAAAEGCGENTPALESKPIKSGHAPVNGIEMYYEVHGSGYIGEVVMT